MPFQKYQGPPIVDRFRHSKGFDKSFEIWNLHPAFNILYIIMKYVTSTETIILQKLSQKKSLVAWTGLIA